MRLPETLACCLVLVVTAPPVAAQAAPDQDVLAVVNALFDGMRTVDSARVRPLFHARARLISVSLRNDEAVAQVDESVEGFIRAVGRPRTETWDERIRNVRVERDGPLASVWADYTFYRGATLSHCGVDHFLLLREGSAWKIIELSDTRRTTGCGEGGEGA